MAAQQVIWGFFEEKILLCAPPTPGNLDVYQAGSHQLSLFSSLCSGIPGINGHAYSSTGILKYITVPSFMRRVYSYYLLVFR